MKRTKGDKMKFPKELHVRYEKPNNEDGYFLASKAIEGEHGEKIAIYELKEIKTLVIKEELVRG
jgi:hypothetical protein